MRFGMVVCHQSILVRRKLAPFYNLKYRCSADVEWVIESLKRSKNIINTHLIISRYLVDGFSITNQKLSWKERFDIYIHYYGFFQTILLYAYIIIRNLLHRLKGKSTKY